MSLSAALQKKIISVAKTIPSLKKEDSNDTYNYVSIDSYYEHVAKKAIEAGLSWIPSELDFSIQEGQDGLIQVQQYGFTLFDAESGESSDNAIKLSISHPFQDAQTTGSSLSYAEKLLMRALFKVVTGEKDADANAPKKKLPLREAIESPFKEGPAANDNAASEKKKPGPKPKKDEAPVEVVADRNTTANAIAALEQNIAADEYDTPPWDDNLAMKTANELIKKIEQCENDADLDQFRLDNEDGIKWLKAEGAKSKEVAVERDRVASIFRSKFEEFNTTTEGAA